MLLVNYCVAKLHISATFRVGHHTRDISESHFTENYFDAGVKTIEDLDISVKAT